MSSTTVITRFLMSVATGLFILFTSGCLGVEVPAPPAPDYLLRARQNDLATHVNWQITGLMSIETPYGYASLPLIWTQRGENIYIRTLPANHHEISIELIQQGKKIIIRDAQGHILTKNSAMLHFPTLAKQDYLENILLANSLRLHELYVASNIVSDPNWPETTKQGSHLHIPLLSLAYWLQGLPANGESAVVIFDQFHRVKILDQRGCIVKLFEYGHFDGYWLPTKMMVYDTVSRLHVNMQINNWSMVQ